MTMNDVMLFWPFLFWASGFAEYHARILLFGGARDWMGISLILPLAAFLAAAWKNRSGTLAAARELFQEIASGPLFFKALSLGVGILFGIGALEARHPPHLGPDYDAINYHVGIPLQHLLIGNLEHIPWSAADLFPLSIQFGLTPFWLAGSTFNKIPQFIGAIWLFILLLRMGRRASPGTYLGWIPALAFFSTHGVMIQLGTAMLDFYYLYFLFGALEAFLARRFYWGSFHLALFCAARSFHIFQVGLVLAPSVFFLFVKSASFRAHFRAALPGLAVGVALLVLLNARSSVLGIQRAGTPVFPLAVCTLQTDGCSGAAGDSIRKTANAELEWKDEYGAGRGPVAWLRHLWTVSVPTRGTNNEFDYPLGLSWILFVILVAFSFRRWLIERKIPVLAQLCFVSWAVWWIGSQQSRWLYPTLILGWLATLEMQKRLRPNALLIPLGISCLLSLVSQARFLKPKLFVPSSAIQMQMVSEAVSDAADPSIALTMKTLYYARPIRLNANENRYFIIREKPSVQPQ